MKVLYVLHPKAAPENWPRSGDTNMASRLMKKLPRDIEVSVSANFSGMSSADCDQLRLDYGIRGLLVDTSPFIKSRSYLKDTMEYLRSIAGGYDVIHFHNATVASIRWMVEMFGDCETPLVYTLHTPPDTGTTFQWHCADDYRSFSRNPKNRLVAVSSSHYTRVLKALGETKDSMPYLTVVANGVEVDQVPPSQDRYDLAVIGRLDPTKDILHALKAARFCDQNAAIVYVGDSWEDSTSVKDDSYYNEVVRFISENGITWYKSLPNYDVRRLLAASKVHITLSRIETYGLTVAEAAVQGTPCIGFDEGGVGELIVDGLTGKKIPVTRCRWEARYDMIRTLYQECLGMDRLKIREFSVQRLSIDNTVSDYVQLYKELVK